MDKKNLRIKDLVTIGVFAVIYFVLMFAVGMIGVIPILFLAYPPIFALVGGVVVMLFMAKVQKPLSLFIFGMLTPLAMFLMGHTYVVVALSLISMLIAEFVRRKGSYKSFTYNMISYALLSTWSCSSLMQMLLAKERYIEMSMMMGKEYVDALEKLVTYPNMLVVYLITFICGMIGALIGRVLLKKHFKKAGIV